MKTLVFGATGMVGQGVLRECLLDPEVTLVQTVGRTLTGQTNPKLHELKHTDPENYTAIEANLSGFDACFFCLGVSTVGMTQEEYERVTYGFTLAAAGTLARLNPSMTFVYLSADGADGSEKGPVHWARVRGKTENALRRLPFKAVYIFRPGLIQPLHGIRSKTAVYRNFYILAKPLLPLLRALRPLFPNLMTSTEEIGRAMIRVVRRGYSKPILKNSDMTES